MTLQGFTQEPGHHDKIEVVQGRQRGRYFGHDIDEVIYTNQVWVESVDKSYPTSSDHHRATDHGHGVRKLVSNDPALLQRVDDGLDIHLTYDSHISNIHSLGSYIVPDPGYFNARSESVTKALNDLTKHYYGVGADLAEARKTCDEFAQVALRVGNGLQALRHGQFKQAASNLLGTTGKGGSGSWSKSISDWWLQYSYGFKPLAHDLYEAQQAAHHALKKNVTLTAHGTGRSHNQQDFNWADWLQHTGSIDSSHWTTLRAHVVNPALYQLNSAGLLNPLSVAWEATGFSFVVDWFVPIGGTLQAITAGVGLESDGGQTTSHQTDELRLTDIRAPVLYGGNYREVGWGYRRTAYASFPMPEIYADVTPYSTPRAINALALVRQLTA